MQISLKAHESAQGSFLALWTVCAGGHGLTAGFTYQLELLRVLKMLPSCNEQHSCVDA